MGDNPTRQNAAGPTLRGDTWTTPEEGIGRPYIWGISIGIEAFGTMIWRHDQIDPTILPDFEIYLLEIRSGTSEPATGCAK